ncbi:hypothetical protein [Streptomyces sp. NPDC091217]|uniref:hypothetical protein n=1 Tax=Streptomyces sp. NPDC091217 TaxID=3365975 RepID=UPI00380CBDAE
MRGVLYERFGAVWEKSYYTFYCLPISMGAMAAHLDRMRAHPDIGGRVLRLEYTSVSLNPNARLFGRDSLLEKFDPDRPAERPVLAASEKELDCPWALYHVRRILPVAKADPTRRGRAPRSVERVDVGRRPHSTGDCAASRSGPTPRSRSTSATGGCGHGSNGAVRPEPMVTAPLYVRDKQVPHFESAWGAHRDRS